jgi:hypothetical protein
MTFDNRRGATPFLDRLSRFDICSKGIGKSPFLRGFANPGRAISDRLRLSVSAVSGRGTRLLIMALVAAGLAFLLSSPEMNVGAWHQSTPAPESPVPTPTDQPPTPPVVTLTPTPEIPALKPPQGSERGTALLVASGIVLAGLIAGVVVFLLEGAISS